MGPPKANLAGDDGDHGGSESVGDLATARGDGRGNRPPPCAGCCSILCRTTAEYLLVAHELEDTLGKVFWVSRAAGLSHVVCYARGSADSALGVGAAAS